MNTTSSCCHLMQLSREFIASLELDSEYFDHTFDRCYCPRCASEVQMPDVLERECVHGCPYEVPKGWCGFGLKVRPAAKTMDVFRNWAVSYHGCPSNVLASILQEGQILMPGDMLIDGTKLPNRLTRGGKERIGI